MISILVGASCFSLLFSFNLIERLFVCDICSKDFKTQGCLNAHLCSTHFDKEKNIPVRFVEMYRLERHFASYSGIRSYSSKHCGKTFGTKDTCDKHELNHNIVAIGNHLKNRK